MTTAPNSETAVAAAEPAAGEAAHNDLVARLVGEAFSEFARGARPTATPSLPSEIPSVSKLPDLSGNDPSSAVPPVHPSAQPAAPKLAEPEKTPSGAHAPDSGDNYAFGEPRCNGAYRPQGNKPDTKTANGSPLLGLPEAESPATPDYYFLRGGNVSGRSPLACQSYPKNAAPIPKFDIEGVRRDFPALHQLVNGKPLIWLDNAATTHKPQAVIDATSQFYSRDNSNIHRAAHALAARSTELFEAGREKVRKFLGAADAKEIIFVRGTTEAINLVAQSYGRKNIGAGDEIIVSKLEHHANIVPWQLLAEQVGATLRVIPINDRGELILDEYVKLLGPKTKFVSVAHVSNSLGTINPVEQIIALAHARGVPVLIDGAQSTPHLPVNVSALDADFYVFSGHKIFAPTGIGALYGKAPLLEAMPPWQGGGHMIKDVRFEKTVYQYAPEKFEAGTPDIAGVVGLGAAIDYLFKVGIPGIAAYEHALLEYATQALATVPGLRPIGTAATKASVLSFVIPGVPNESVARHLDKNGIAVRAGHHCALPAIRHFGLESSVRPSLAFYNTREEVDALVLALRSLKRS
ncbi:MAG: SufS family cysteine desulfurase [Limisphaerales bacterium]